MRATPISEIADGRIILGAWAPAAENDTGKPSRFAITNLDDIALSDDPIWMIEGLLPSAGFGVVFGPPKSGKSFLLADALFHVAMGRPWAGKAVKQGAVVYITGEGVAGFKRRLVAMRRHYDVDGAGTPFGVITVAPDFGHNTGDAEQLIAEIRGWLASIGNLPLAAVALDTLARAMKGADENVAKDMTTFVDNCGLVADAFGCLVVGVHHAGKDVARGSRGSNALDGAVDVMWSVEKGEVSSTAAIHHMKDGEDGLSWQFRLAPFDLSEGGRNKGATSTCVVEIVSEPDRSQQRAQQGGGRLGDQPRLLLSIVRDAVGDAGEFLKGNPNVPHDVKSLAREALKRYLPLKGYWDDDCAENSKRAVLSRDLKTLKVRGYIGLGKDHLWLVGGKA